MISYMPRLPGRNASSANTRLFAISLFLMLGAHIARMRAHDIADIT